VLLSGQASEPGGQRGRDRELRPASAVALGSGLKVLAVPQRQWRQLRQVVVPPGQAFLVRGFLSPLVLPSDVVGIPERGLGQGGGLPEAPIPVDVAELAEKDPYGPPVGDDVVLRYQQDVLVLRERDRGDPHQRASCEVEGGALVVKGEAAGSRGSFFGPVIA
jgi:hypothetical protein